MIRLSADDNEASWKDCGASYNSLHWHNPHTAIFTGSTGITNLCHIHQHLHIYIDIHWKNQIVVKILGLLLNSHQPHH